MSATDASNEFEKDRAGEKQDVKGPALKSENAHSEAIVMNPATIDNVPGKLRYRYNVTTRLKVHEVASSCLGR